MFTHLFASDSMYVTAHDSQLYKMNDGGVGIVSNTFKTLVPCSKSPFIGSSCEDCPPVNYKLSPIC